MYYITLVHGTFAVNAEWIQPNSTFERNLQIGLEDSVSYEKFDWNGKNSHKERLIAGENLSRQLETSFEKHPNKEHIVIAHSHGGNIALYALKKLDRIPKDFKLVTLATPFINCEGNDSERYTKTFSWIIAIAVFGICFLLTESILSNFSYSDNLKNILNLLIPYLVAGSLYHLLKEYFKKSENKSREFFEKIQIGNYHKKIKTLSVSIKGDEAYSWLKFAVKPEQTINDLFPLTWSLGSVVSRFIIILFSLILGILMILSQFQKYLKLNVTELYFKIQGFNEPVFQIIAYIFMFSLLVLILIIPATLLFRSNPLIFGWESISNGFFFKVYATNRLPKNFDTTLLLYDRSIKQSKDLLHSQPIISSTIISDIAKWIRK